MLFIAKASVGTGKREEALESFHGSWHAALLHGPIKYPVQGKVAAVRAPDGHMLGLFEPAEGTQ